MQQATAAAAEVAAAAGVVAAAAEVAARLTVARLVAARLVAARLMAVQVVAAAAEAVGAAAAVAVALAFGLEAAGAAPEEITPTAGNGIQPRANGSPSAINGKITPFEPSVRGMPLDHRGSGEPSITPPLAYSEDLSRSRRRNLFRLDRETLARSRWSRWHGIAQTARNGVTIFSSDRPERNNRLRVHLFARSN